MNRIAALLILVAIAATTAGCIRHKAVITSEPTAAKVVWNEEYRGRTPIEIPFIWHWKYTVQIEKEGYESLDTVEHFRARPWFIFPFDLLFEAIPVVFTDTRKLHYDLDPKDETL